MGAVERTRAGPSDVSCLFARGASKLSRAPATTLPIPALLRDVTRLLTTLETPGATAPDPAAVRF